MPWCRLHHQSSSISIEILFNKRPKVSSKAGLAYADVDAMAWHSKAFTTSLSFFSFLRGSKKPINTQLPTLSCIWTDDMTQVWPVKFRLKSLRTDLGTCHRRDSKLAFSSVLWRTSLPPETWTHSWDTAVLLWPWGQGHPGRKEGQPVGIWAP